MSETPTVDPVIPVQPKLVASLYLQFIATAPGRVEAQILSFVPPAALRMVARQLSTLAANMAQEASPIIVPRVD